MNMEKGLYNKFIVQRVDGKPINDFVFVLRPEKDKAALNALKEYAKSTKNKKLKSDLRKVIGDIERG